MTSRSYRIYHHRAFCYIIFTRFGPSDSLHNWSLVKKYKSTLDIFNCNMTAWVWGTACLRRSYQVAAAAVFWSSSRLRKKNSALHSEDITTAHHSHAHTHTHTYSMHVDWHRRRHKKLKGFCLKMTLMRSVRSSCFDQQCWVIDLWASVTT